MTVPTSANGSPSADPLYIAARRVLLDALDALSPHHGAFIVAGAQAVYLRANDADLSETVAPYTTDGDLALDPERLGPDPELEKAMTDAGFVLLPQPGGHTEPGTWIAITEVNGEAITVPIDLIVPEGVAPSGGRRGARLGVHGNRAARRAVGLEAALVDHDEMEIAALEPSDERVAKALVAGTAALLVAKAHKLHDRVRAEKEGRINDKDASDVIRLMRTGGIGTVAATVRRLLADDRSSAVTRDALGYLEELFGQPGREGIRMATDALRLALDPAEIEALAVAYVANLLDATR